MRRSTLKRLALMLATGGVLLQTTSCAQYAADAVAGATSSILDAYIRSAVNDWLNLGTGLSLTSLLT